MLNTAVLAPMPTASAAIATTVNPGAPAEVPQAVPHILPEQIEMFAGRSREDAADGVTPQSQKRHRSSPGEHVLSVLAESLRHLVAEVAAELGRKEPQERAEESLGSRHGSRARF
jgi:hypothetical protein